VTGVAGRIAVPGGSRRVEREVGVDPSQDPRQSQTNELAAARALWDDLAVKARAIHCPDHMVGPWRIVVTGETRESMKLQVYGCCPRLGQAVTGMIRADPRTSKPS
jgi:hypothetical protein